MSKAREYDGTEVAVVGISVRVPGADTVDGYWKNIRAGTVSITQRSDAELLEAGGRAQDIALPNYVKAGGVIRDRARFDADLFGVAPRQAVLMDPQQRHFLECCWAAMENAGYAPRARGQSVGVYAGASGNAYLMFHVWPALLKQSDAGFERFLTTLIASSPERLPTQVSYKLNLSGPSVAVSTACSTSLVAVHLACQGLLAHECDMALAGGTCLSGGYGGHYFLRDGPFSPDGCCRPFDAKAQGTVGGSGVGVVVLKRLEDAIRDHDTIHAVVLGSAINNDGSDKIGYTAPSVNGQESVITQALAMAGVSPESIGYLEAHGTATPLGDPIEVRAITKAYAAKTAKTGFCAMGSVKANIGHLDSAAGIASFIKAVLAVEHSELPPLPHFETANPQIDFAQAPVYVNRELQAWKSDGPRRAAVSSFGIGGTNAHAIIEQAPVVTPEERSTQWEVLCLSALTPAALERMTRNLHDYLKSHPELALADIAYTLQVGRAELPFRRAVCCRESPATVLAASLHADASECQSPRLGFSFSSDIGWPSGLLLGRLPTFRQELAACASELSQSGMNLFELLSRHNGRALSEHEQAAASFALRAAIARQLIASGAEPVALRGRGALGQAIAAYVKGSLPLRDALHSALNNRYEKGQADADLEVDPEIGQIYVEIGWGEPVERLMLTGPDIDREIAGLLANVWARGVSVDWARGSAHHALRRVPLPSYPFGGAEHWLPAFSSPTTADSPAPASQEGLLVRSWKRAPQRAEGLIAVADTDWLLLSSGSAWEQSLADDLRDAGAQVSVVAHEGQLEGSNFRRKAHGAFAELLLRECTGSIVYLWSLMEGELGDRALEALWSLGRVLTLQPRSQPLNLIVVTQRRLDVHGDEPPCEHSWLQDFGNVLGDRGGSLRYRLLDIDRTGPKLSVDLLVGAAMPGHEPVAAWRGPYRWLPGVEPEKAPPSPVKPMRLAVVGCDRVEDLEALAGLRGALPAGSSVWVAGRMAHQLVAPDIAGFGNLSPVLQALGPASSLRELRFDQQCELIGEDCRVLHESNLRESQEEFLAWTQKLCVRWALDHFRHVGLDTRPGTRCATSTFYAHALPEFHKFVGFLLDILRQEGCLEFAADGVEFRAHRIADMDELRQQFLAHIPRARTWFDFVQNCVSSYPAVFAGRRAPHEVLYPGGSYGPLHEMEQNTPDFTNRHECHELLLRTVKRLLAATERRLKVLEVGAGTGIVTWDLMEAIGHGDIDYVFSDIGRSFVAEAEREAARRGLDCMRFLNYDISNEPGAQGLSPSSFDLIVAFNVVQATPSVVATLTHLRSLLAPDGILIMLNTVLDLRWYGLVFGLATGWWDYTDEPLREHSPLMPVASWTQVLRRAGFDEVGAFPASGGEHRALMIARAPASAQRLQQDWLSVDLRAARAPLEELAASGVTLSPLPDGGTSALPDGLDALVLLEQFASADTVREASYGHAAQLRQQRQAERRRWQQLADLHGVRARLRIARGAPLGATELMARGDASRDGLSSAWTSIEWGSPSQERLGAVVTRILQSGRGGCTFAIAEGDAVLTALDMSPESAGQLVSARDPVTLGGASEIQPLEQAIGEMWQEVLGIPPVNRHDYFFEVGGDSLAGLQILARIQAKYRVEFGIRELLEMPTVAGMAEKVSQRLSQLGASSATAASAIPALESGGANMHELLERLGSLPDDVVRAMVKASESTPK